MKGYQKIIKGFLFCLFLSITAFSNKTQYLGVIEGITRDDLQANNLYVIDQLRDHSFVILNEKDLETLQKNRYSHVTLDENPFSKLYYLVYAAPELRSDLSAVSRILADFDDCYLVQVEKENLISMLDLKAEFNFLELEPMSLQTVEHPKLKDLAKQVTHNPIIQEIVDKVNEDTLLSQIRWLQNVGTRHCSYDDMEDKVVPWMIEKFKAYGCDTIFTMDVSGYNAPNIIGVKLGKKYPTMSTYAAIGAHVDAVPRASRNRGADDNATGCATFLEAARIFKDYDFEHTIYYLAWNCEEVGLKGSAVHAKYAKNIRDSIIGVINTEMTGHVPPGQTGYIAVTPKQNMQGTVALKDLFIKMGEKYTTQAFYDDPSNNTSSDHASYWRQGFTAIKLRQKKMGSAYHTQGDTIGNRNGLNTPAQVTRVAQTALATLCEMASVMQATPVMNPISYKNSGQCIPFLVNGTRVNVFMNIKENGRFTLKLYNAKGRNIILKRSYSFAKSMQPIHLKSLAGSKESFVNGIYFIEVQTGKIRSLQPVLMVN